MSNAVIEYSIHTRSVRQYPQAYSDSTSIETKASDAVFFGMRHPSLLASLLVSALGASASVGMPVQQESHSTFGQVWTGNPSTLFALDLQTPLRASVSLSAEEHSVLRQAIWDSVEIVAQGRFVNI